MWYAIETLKLPATGPSAIGPENGPYCVKCGGLS